MIKRRHTVKTSPKIERKPRIFRTVYLSSNIVKSCDHCGYSPGFDKDISDGINHYISEHKYELLHVGQEWSEDRNGATIHHTVAILGCTVPESKMPLKPIPKVIVVTGNNKR
jgi:hypothetical protein